MSENNNLEGWSNILGSFKQKAQEFKDNFDELLSTESTAKKDPELFKEYKRLVSSGRSIRTTIENLTSKVDEAYRWVKSKLGLNGVSTLQGLGLLPAIPIVASLSAIALMTKFSTDFYIYLDKVEQFEKLEAKYGAQTASNIITNVFDPKRPFFGIDAKWFLFAGLASLVYMNRDKLGFGRG